MTVNCLECRKPDPEITCRGCGEALHYNICAAFHLLRKCEPDPDDEDDDE